MTNEETKKIYIEIEDDRFDEDDELFDIEAMFQILQKIESEVDFCDKYLNQKWSDIDEEAKEEIEKNANVENVEEIPNLKYKKINGNLVADCIIRLSAMHTIEGLVYDHPKERYYEIKISDNGIIKRDEESE